jgi:hypothetical protein
MDICKPKAGFRVKITQHVTDTLEAALNATSVTNVDWDILEDMLRHEGHRVGNRIDKSGINSHGIAGQRIVHVSGIGRQNRYSATVGYFLLGDFLEINELRVEEEVDRHDI